MATTRQKNFLMNVGSPQKTTDESLSLFDLWPLLAGPLVFGGIIFWTSWFIDIAKAVSAYHTHAQASTGSTSAGVTATTGAASSLPQDVASTPSS